MLNKLDFLFASKNLTGKWRGKSQAVDTRVLMKLNSV